MGLDIGFGGLVRLPAGDSCLEPYGFFTGLELLGVIVVEDHGGQREGCGGIPDGVSAEGSGVTGDGFVDGLG